MCWRFYFSFLDKQQLSKQVAISRTWREKHKEWVLISNDIYWKQKENDEWIIQKLKGGK